MGNNASAPSVLITGNGGAGKTTLLNAATHGGGLQGSEILLKLDRGRRLRAVDVGSGGDAAAIQQQAGPAQQQAEAATQRCRHGRLLGGPLV